MVVTQLFIDAACKIQVQWRTTDKTTLYVINNLFGFLNFYEFKCRQMYTKPHSGTSSSISYSPIPSPIISSDSPLCTSITSSLFHSRLKTYLFHKSYPGVSLLPPGLLSRTIAWTVSSELLGFCLFKKIFFLFFRFYAVC